MLATLAACMLLALAGRTAPAPPRTSPPLVLWAGEQPESLGFIDARQVGVAYLAATLALRRESVDISPRRQPLHVPEGTALTAVFRIEAVGTPLDDVLAKQAAGEIVRMVLRSRATTVQVDFEARVSERAFYVRLLTELRGRVPEKKRIEVTALASGCLFDDWLADLPAGLVDGVVAKAFRMGPDDARVRQALAEGEPLKSTSCRESIGVAVDEPLPKVPAGVRVHAFNPQPWTESALAKLREELGR